jgi:TetR/AcrR family fatty acid metabolism transcriptional regulator
VGSHSKDKRERIIDAAIKLFARLGYHQTKLDEVAKQAEIAKGTLYLYFKSKEDLFIKCLLDGYEKSRQRAAQIIASRKSIKERLLELLELQEEIFRHNGPLIQQFIQSGVTIASSEGAPKKILEMMKDKVELFAEFFREGIENGEFSDRLTPVQMSLIFHQIFDLNLKFQMFHAPTVSPQKCCEMLSYMFRAD